MTSTTDGTGVPRAADDRGWAAFWLFPLLRVLGVNFPGFAAAVQLSAEYDARRVQERLRRLEDPISALHPDVPTVSALLYGRLRAGYGGAKVELSDEEVALFARPLALLEGAGRIRGTHAIGSRPFVGGVWLSDPEYLVYLATLHEDPDRTGPFLARVDAAPAGTWIRGAELAEEYGLPLAVVRAVFELYARRGLGVLSRELGTANYLAQA